MATEIIRIKIQFMNFKESEVWRDTKQKKKR